MAITLQARYSTIESTMENFAGGTPVSGDSIRKINDLGPNNWPLISSYIDSTQNPKYFHSDVVYLGVKKQPCLYADGINDWLSSSSPNFGTNPIFVVIVFSADRLQAFESVETMVATKNGGSTARGWAIAAGNGWTHTQYNFFDSEYYDGSVFGGASAHYFNGPNNLTWPRWHLTLLDANCMMIQFPSHLDGGNGLHLFRFADNIYPGNVKFGELRVYTGTATLTERENIWEEIKNTWSFGNSAFYRIATSSDDAEETLSSGTVTLTGSNIDMGYVAGAERQECGFRFNSIQVEKNAVLRHAKLAFVAPTDKTSTSPTLTFTCQAADNPTTFTTANKDLSNRTKTTATVVHSGIMPWYNGRNYLSDDLITLINEINARGGWSIGNSIVILITANIGGTSEVRAATSYNLSPANSAILWIEIEPGISKLINANILDGLINGRLL